MESRDIVNDFLGVGWKFPIEVEETTGRIKTVSYEEDVREAIHLIMMTKVGERMMQPGYGCRISDFVFETMDYSSVSQLKNEIMEALVLWEPRIVEIEVDIRADDTVVGKLNVNIGYVVRMTNNPYNLVYPYYMNEGIKP